MNGQRSVYTALQQQLVMSLLLLLLLLCCTSLSTRFRCAYSLRELSSGRRHVESDADIEQWTRYESAAKLVDQTERNVAIVDCTSARHARRPAPVHADSHRQGRQTGPDVIRGGIR
jgi:hypothetical protein